MSTLHLIDADSTQACPAVMSLIGDRIRSSSDSEDPLLLLGGAPLVQLAHEAGISHAQRLRVPFGNPRLTRAIDPWVRSQKHFTKIHCWSIGAVSLAVDTWRNTPIELSLVHRPTDQQVLQLKRALRRAPMSKIRVCTLSDPIRKQATPADVSAEVDQTLSRQPDGRPVHTPSADDLRTQWQAPRDSRRVVALLNDHPSQTNAMDAAAVVCLAGASLTDDQGRTLGIKLLMHPGQHNRQRAQYFLADQSDRHRVVQDVRAINPRAILPACDAALALGPNAAGLSLHQALDAGLPVITAGPTIVDTHGSPPPHLYIARSSAHKDIAHLLHTALSASRVLHAI